MTLGQQIKQARENKNLSQEELAEQLGVSRQAVSEWENDTSIPQGINRELMSKILDLDLLSVQNEVSPKNRLNWIGRIGWGLSFILAILLIVVICIWNNEKNSSKETLVSDGYIDEIAKKALIPDISENMAVSGEEKKPGITRITFYDKEQNEVTQEALWYDSEKIESILVQWEGGTPNNIKLFLTASGSETTELSELLFTKSILDGDSEILLDAKLLKEKLKDLFQGHIFFELDFGENIVASEIYNMFNHESIEENG